MAGDGRWRPLAGLVTGYVLGTFPSAAIASRLASTDVDVAHAGSTNPGAANAAALLGPRWGAAVLGADIGKGVLSCALGRVLAGDDGAHLAGSAAVVGHCYPVWTGFARGGKGVAASTGQCLMTFPAYFPIDLVVAYGAARWRRRAATAVAISSGVWVTAALVWWRRGLPNAWGPAPSGMLPVAALVSSTVILARFAQTRHQGVRGWPPTGERT